MEKIDNIPDRLRWCRHAMGLMQSEVAAEIGLSRYQYILMETGACQVYPLDVVDKLSKFYGIAPELLLDDYNQFLSRDPAQLLKDQRKKTGLSRKAFAHLTGIPETSLKGWETGQKQISRASWERYFGDGKLATLLDLR
ncbi:MAG: helix-turn-helix transcriptional regulator [Oscillospiraceae bacterium]|nr:helix-turn-helix transcriptional regulator [Oscillospiraceae bacterium]